MDEPTRIYVDRNAIERNIREGAAFPPICVRDSDGITTTFCNDVRVLGPSRVVYDRQGLHDGTRVWVETHAPVEIKPT